MRPDPAILLRQLSRMSVCLTLPTTVLRNVTDSSRPRGLTVSVSVEAKTVPQIMGPYSYYTVRRNPKTNRKIVQYIILSYSIYCGFKSAAGTNCITYEFTYCTKGGKNNVLKFVVTNDKKNCVAGTSD